MDRKIIDKVRKCLALARSGNENEAASALAKARQLMDVHGITEADIAMADVEEAVTRGSRTQRSPVWELILSETVCRALGVTSFADARGDRCFIGRAPAAEIASYAFAVLFRRLKKERADYIKAHLKRCKLARKRQRADIFCQAWASMVFMKVKALVPERQADALVEQYLTERYPGLVVVEPRSAKPNGACMDHDRLRGAVAGSDVDLNPGLHSEAASPLALA
ncbi:DUF2786 domain-containing protein [Nitratireductor soli]|uniref:DUF2786 domain-containing protein n=1 Tax=Nitratireductor soli TaxID=1670619 RepID=UPI00065DC0F8|nr:DUF2786 domain-containing protein [Nitratireductor soli]